MADIRSALLGDHEAAQRLRDLPPGTRVKWRGKMWTVVDHRPDGTLLWVDEPMSKEYLEMLEGMK